jgi:hypothetical protein
LFLQVQGSCRTHLEQVVVPAAEGQVQQLLPQSAQQVCARAEELGQVGTIERQVQHLRPTRQLLGTLQFITSQTTLFHHHS